jgi:anti-sigma-K factor RskA
MLDPQLDEQASLYVLGLLNPTEKRAFEARQQASSELQETVRELQVALENVVLSLPAANPPARVLARIQAAVTPITMAAEDSVKTPYPWWVYVLPIAACLVLGWIIGDRLFFQNARSVQPRASQPPMISQKNRMPQGIRPLNSAQDGSDSPVVMESGTKKLIPEGELPKVKVQLQQEREKVRAMANQIRQLEQNAAELEKQRQLLFRGAPGMRQVVVANLYDPRGSSQRWDFAQSAPNLLWRQASNELASAARGRLNNQTNSSDASSTLETKQLAGGMASEVVVNSAMGTTTTTAASFIQTNSAVAIATGFHAPSRGGANTAASSDRGLAAGSADPSADQNTSTHLLAMGVAIYDQTDQTLSLVVQNLPALRGNDSFQLWALDANSTTPSNLGAVSSLGGGFGQANLSIAGTNFIPSQFFITVEPGSGLSSPTGPTVLASP